MSELRGTGRTTQQIKNLPDGSVYVVHGRSFKKYCQEIAKGLQKQIIFVSPDEVERKLRGIEFKAFDIDHHTFTTLGFGELITISTFLQSRVLRQFI